MNKDFNLYENIDSNILEAAYCKKNYLIAETSEGGEEAEENLAVIYFASNAVFHPNNLLQFDININQKNRFEWFKLRITRARKHIYMRDILKQFYAEGINDKIDSLDKIIEFLQKETHGMRTITVGTSAGGYMALLAGLKLKSEIIFAFSPFVQIEDSYRIHTSLENNKYKNLVEDIRHSKSQIIYFSPIYSKEDFMQLDLLKDVKIPNLHIFKYKSDIHGKTLKRNELYCFINSSPKFLSFVNKYILHNRPSKNLIKYVFRIKYFLTMRLFGIK